MKKTHRPEIAPGITVDRDEGFGKPTVKGTDVSVEEVLNRLVAGATTEAVEADSGLTRQGILAAIGYAAEIAAEEPQARNLDLGDWPEEVTPGITRDPRVRFGKAVIKDRRIDAASVLGNLASGESFDDLHREFSLTPEQIRDAICYGNMLVAREVASAV